jgi:hypothetical protein
LIVGGAIVAIFALLALIGSLGGSSDEGGGPSGSTSTSTRTARTTPARTRRSAAPAVPTQASVRIVPTGTVYVCLVDGGGRVLIPGSQFAAGQQVPVYKARKLRITLGNNAVQMRVNGRAMAVPASSTAIAYEITTGGARPLPLDQAPTCT